MIYYVHAIPIYGTDIEKAELMLIKRSFPKAEIINPSGYPPKESINEMEHFKRLVRNRDGVVFSRFKGKITSGVGIETNYAIDLGKEVYTISKKDSKRVASHVKSLSHGETLKLISSKI